MQAVELIPPAPENSSSDRASSGSAHASTSHEGFDTVMGRVLARSSQESNDDSEEDEFSSEDRRTNESKKPDSTNAGAPDPSACVDPSAAQPAPPPQSAPASASNNPRPGIAPVSADQTTTPGLETTTATTDTAADANATAENSTLAEELSLTGNNSSERVADPRASSTAQPESTGISGAKYHLAMQKAENTNNSAGSTEQNLPADAAMNSGEDRTIHPVDFKLHQDKHEASVIPAASLASTTSTETSAAAAAAEWPSPARSLERTHDMMSLQALRLRESGQDSLQVVIKPDTGLQLSLNLQMRDGNVEMRALLHRGNFELLNLHWPELQQQLESRGIRLGPLAHGDAAADGQGGFAQSPDQQTSEDSAAAAGAFAEFALNSTLVPKPSPQSGTATKRGWESWA